MSGAVDDQSTAAPAEPEAPASAPATSPLAQMTSAPAKKARGSTKAQLRAQDSGQFLSTTPPAAAPASDDGKTAFVAASDDGKAAVAATTPAPTGPDAWPDDAKAQIAEHTANVQALTKANTDWRDAGNKALAQNRQLWARIELAEAKIAELGGELDPRDLKILAFEAEKAQGEHSQQAQAAAAERQRAQQHEKMVADYTKGFATDLARARKEIPGVSLDEVKKMWGGMLAIDENVTVDDVIALVQTRMRQAQAKANAAAPSNVKNGASSTTVQYPHGREGRIQRLKDRGLLDSHET